MSIYSRKDYRKIYEQHYGPIPLDEKGRRYDIHHIDGDHSNDYPTNLKAVTLDEHYAIHYAQGDLGACRAIMMRMDRTAKEVSELARKFALERLENGTHHFLGPDINQKRIDNGTHNFVGKNNPSKLRVANGTHHFLGGEIQRKQVADGTHHFLKPGFQKEIQRKRIENGTHNLLGPHSNQQRLEDGSHPSQQKWTCPHCNKSGKGKGNYTRHHGNNCKLAI